MNLIKNEKGQTLVIIFMVMIVALSIGLAISSRFISTLSGLSTADLSNRSYAAAEALTERLILLPNETLRDYIQNNSCGSNCSLEITGADGVISTATATLTYLGESADPFLVNVSQNDVSEVVLSGYNDNANLSVCWNSSEASIYGVMLSGDIGNYGIDPYAYNSIGSIHGDNNFNLASSAYGYTNCFVVNGRTSPKALRLRSLYSDVDVYIVPDAGNLLPSQGVLIETQGQTKGITKKITVIKTAPSLPAQFDYTLFSKSPTELLSN